MARKSFTLQKNVTGYGSYISYPSGSEAASFGLAVREDDDSRLKSDGILVAPILSNPARSGSLLPYVSFFEAEVVDYQAIQLEWDAPLNDLNLVESVDTVVATQIIVVYSEEGEPQTISDGITLVNDNNINSYYHSVPIGKWAYYTLFVRFQSRGGDNYYEPAAKLAVLTPKFYGSTDELYARIPEYYRLLDEDLDVGEGGPLYKYLSIFGYEIDRVRTAIDQIMIMKDPKVANSQVLDYISQDLGTGLRVHELGATRLRNLINIIGFLRRSEGTKASLELAIQALTGSDVEVDDVSKRVKVYAQRVNLLRDPNLEVLVSGILDAGFAATQETEFSITIDAKDASEWTQDPSWTYNPNDPIKPGNIISTTAYEGGTPAATGGGSINTDQEPVWSYDEDPDSAGSIYILQSLTDYIMVKSEETLYFSMQKNPFLGYQDSISRVRLVVGGPTNLVVVAESTTPITLGGIKYWPLEVVDGYNDYIGTFIQISVGSEIDPAEDFGEMLLERSPGGKYFDGNTSIGGWLVDSDTISDYRWYNPEDPNSSVEPDRTDTFSVYNSNYSKTRAVVDRLIKDYLPVTELTSGLGTIYSNRSIEFPKWVVTFNHIPGVPYG